MPKQAPMDRLAEAVAVGRAQEQSLAICKSCGLTASDPDPVVCTVCGGKSFEVLTAEMVESLVRSEGGVADEPTYDGRKLRWTRDARRALNGIDEAYLRRRTKARIEKSARMRRQGTVTLEFARKLIEEETGLPFAGSPGATTDAAAPAPERGANGRRLIARDEQRNPLLSAFDWTEDAIARILRVPAGFMRDRTQARVEELAHERGIGRVDLECVEAGIAFGRQLMEQMISEHRAGSDPASREESAAGVTSAKSSEPEPRSRHEEQPLNEVRPIAELAALRMLLTREPKEN